MLTLPGFTGDPEASPRGGAVEAPGLEGLRPGFTGDPEASPSGGAVEAPGLEGLTPALRKSSH